MPTTRLGTFFDDVLTCTNRFGGTPAGSKAIAVSPWRGWLKEVGFCVNSAVTSAMTFAVAIGDNQLSPTASNFVECISSTQGTFSSTSLFEGNACSVVPLTPVYVNAGDAIQWTTSGGQSSTVGVNLYAIVRRG